MRKIKWYGLVGGSIVCIIFLFTALRLYDNSLHIVFCDVGQGDAIFIRTPTRKEVIIDGGPNTQILDCLSEHLPFWDRTISMVINTHPHYDHFRGLIDIFNRYTVAMIGRENLAHDSLAYRVLEKSMVAENASMLILERGKTIEFSDGVRIDVLGPDAEFISQESDNSIITHTNPPSLILTLRYGNFSALFPGDSDGEDLERFIPAQSTYTVFAMPHHGSENGYTQAVSDHISAQLAVVSAGKGNRYGHPHAKVLELLKDKKIPFLRTDQSGSIHIIVSQSGEMQVKTHR